jgi:hypothetical protein
MNRLKTSIYEIIWAIIFNVGFILSMFAFNKFHIENSLFLAIYTSFCILIFIYGFTKIEMKYKK